VSTLYSDYYYLPWCKEKGKTVSADKYHIIYCSQYNTGFQMPKSDICRICDELIIKTNEADNEGKENERKKLKEQNMLHLDEVKKMQHSLKIETE
jgi:hypothetical protein